jgi:hypothetical protein
MLLNLVTGVSKATEAEVKEFDSIVSLEINSDVIDLESSPSRLEDFPSKETLLELGKNGDVKKYEIFLSDMLYTRSLESSDYLLNPRVGVFSVKGVEDNFYLMKLSVILKLVKV